MRALAPAQLLAADLARIGGCALNVASGEFPVWAVAVEGHHLALLRDYAHGVNINVDERPFWVAAPAEWNAALPSILAVMRGTGLCARLRLSEVIVACTPWLEQRRGGAWQVSFPGTPVPTEAWIKDQESSIGLFQSEAAVRVVVWVGSQLRSRTITTLAQLGELEPWLVARLAEQTVAQQAEQAAARLKPSPRARTLAEILADLRAGQSFQTGGGRAWTKYSWDGERIQAAHFDEGLAWDESVSEQHLADAIAAYPAVFA